MVGFVDPYRMAMGWWSKSAAVPVSTVKVVCFRDERLKHLVLTDGSLKHLTMTNESLTHLVLTDEEIVNC